MAAQRALTGRSSLPALTRQGTDKRSYTRPCFRCGQIDLGAGPTLQCRQAWPCADLLEGTGKQSKVPHKSPRRFLQYGGLADSRVFAETIRQTPYGGLSAVLRVDLAHHRFEMDLDGCFTDAELSRDLLVRVAAEETAQDLAFATRDTPRLQGADRGRGIAKVRRAEAPVPDEQQRRLRWKHLLTEHDELNRAAQRLDRHVAQKASADARVDRLREQAR